MASIANPRLATEAKGIVQLGGSNATWLATAPKRERQPNVIVELRDRFNLTPTEACAAIRQANVIREKPTCVEINRAALSLLPSLLDRWLPKRPTEHPARGPGKTPLGSRAMLLAQNSRTEKEDPSGWFNPRRAEED